jgi:hypothetical protein
MLLGKPAADAFIDVSHLPADFNSLLESQALTMSLGELLVAVFTVPHPTAPYKGPRGGRSMYYDLAFAALKTYLAAPPVCTS